MALREITPQIFTGGPDAISEHWNTAQPTFILRLDQSVSLNRVNHVPCKTVHVAHSDCVTEEHIVEWLQATLPVLRAGGKVLVLCSEGNNRSCTAASVILAVFTNRPWGTVLEELHEKFLTQGDHNWWPYSHWRSSITRCWLKATQDFLPGAQLSVVPTPAKTVAAKSAAPPSPQQFRARSFRQ